MLLISLSLLSLFLLFQFLYIFIPLFSIKDTVQPVNSLSEKGITILVPAYNEEKVIINCLQGILNLQYSNFEVIFISDGSTDSTLSILNRHLDSKKVNFPPSNTLEYQSIINFFQSSMYPNIKIIEKMNGGKADALNAGIEFSSNEIVITLDADSILAPDSLSAMNQAFEDPTVLAAGGMVQISQGFHGDYKNPKPTFKMSGLVRYQIIQYLTDFYLHKTTQSSLKAITVIAGAFGAFRKHALLEAGGYRKTVGEDLDITLRMHMLIKEKYKNHKLIFVPTAICFTECPTGFKDLLSQRIRWQKGFIDCLINFRKSFFLKLKAPVSLYILIDSLLLGTINAFPTLFLPLFIIFNTNYAITIFFLSVTVLLALYRSFITIIVSRRFNHKYSVIDYIKIFLFVPIEIFTYRLLGLLFVTLGSILYLKNKDGWSPIKRVGVNNQSYSEDVLLNKRFIK